ncbi:MAG: GNAT family N-acetyltransferase [Paenibacillus dendritiformis]|uniref:GNAT family N-acetyltransferase n=1 Tax=uncultured Paenibacillus sp. TaxID=227322 RepID=UPI0025E237B9|nr:GNAT family N-acetyltransferase [uncultured Paenibacillus sp.]MDU5144244.1 GNAT family N-acetyltransferase [Paenibacillus dendritiformis]
MTTESVRLYDAATLSDLCWPDSADGRYAKSFLLPLMESNVSAYIRNANTRLMALSVDGMVLPVTAGDGEYGDNTFVCSPYTHYVRYAREELDRLPSRPLRAALSVLLNGIGAGLRAARFDACVMVNNWLLSTNLYPERLTESHMRVIVATLKRQYPGHAIMLRSLTSSLHGPLLEGCRREGACLVPSRQIYLLRPADPAWQNAKARWLLKRDYALIERHGYTIDGPGQIGESDVPRIEELYGKLYLEKYSRYNPDFSREFIRLALRDGILQLHGLRKDGRLDAVLGFFCRDGIMTTPLFGYDTALPQRLGLYRMLSAALLELARENGHLLHESAGAAQFKRNRGARADIEYSAVFCDHLPIGTRLAWRSLAGLLTRVGIPVMRKYKL